MEDTFFINASAPLRVFNKETVRHGKAIRLSCVEIDGQNYCVTGRLVKVVTLEEEWYEDINNPRRVIRSLADLNFGCDIFTFWQRVPETEPKYNYFTEWESLAVLPVKTFDHWWNRQANTKTRNMIRKSQKAGVEVREAAFDDNFIRGMVDIFSEAPVRQGFRFWHYGKDFETVKREFSQFLFREDLIGAYYQGELIGFAMLANAGRFGLVGMFLGKMKHRDKATNNALIAKMVELCEKRRLSYLVYTTWRETSLVDFKRHSGFQEMRVPRYFVPLTSKGRLALKLGFHRGLRDNVPGVIKNPLKKLRRQWYNLRWRSANFAK
jgi:hypothetical protein